jgi:ParB-like chromosome segregation protein Spo0J
MQSGRRIHRGQNGAARRPRQGLPPGFKMATKIVQRSTASLLPYARNARVHSEAQLDALERAMRRFGFVTPVAVDDAGGIWAGHARVIVAHDRLGLTRVPTIDISYLSPEERRAYALADNQIALLASWDEELLTGELADLQLGGFDLDAIGFSDADLAGLGVGGPGQPGDAPREKVPSSWAVVVECKDEADQVALIDRLQADGYKVKGTIG